jgi:hypothetical protein
LGATKGELDVAAVDVVAWSVLHAFEDSLLDILQVFVVPLVLWHETVGGEGQKIAGKSRKILTDRKLRNLLAALGQLSCTQRPVLVPCTQRGRDNRRFWNLQQPGNPSRAASQRDPPRNLRKFS